MSRKNYLFTSESVSEGHPDKICDRISDAVLDAFLSEEEMARVACETFATTNRVVIGGEVGLSDQSKLKLGIKLWTFSLSAWTGLLDIVQIHYFRPQG